MADDCGRHDPREVPKRVRDAFEHLSKWSEEAFARADDMFKKFDGLSGNWAWVEINPVKSEAMFKAPRIAMLKRAAWYVFDRIVIPTVTTTAAILSAIAVVSAMRM